MVLNCVGHLHESSAAAASKLNDSHGQYDGASKTKRRNVTFILPSEDSVAAQSTTLTTRAQTCRLSDIQIQSTLATLNHYLQTVKDGYARMVRDKSAERELHRRQLQLLKDEYEVKLKALADKSSKAIVEPRPRASTDVRLTGPEKFSTSLESRTQCYCQDVYRSPFYQRRIYGTVDRRLSTKRKRTLPPSFEDLDCPFDDLMDAIDRSLTKTDHFPPVKEKIAKHTMVTPGTPKQRPSSLRSLSSPRSCSTASYCLTVSSASVSSSIDSPNTSVSGDDETPKIANETQNITDNEHAKHQLDRKSKSIATVADTKPLVKSGNTTNCSLLRPSLWKNRSHLLITACRPELRAPLLIERLLLKMQPLDWPLPETRLVNLTRAACAQCVALGMPCTQKWPSCQRCTLRLTLQKEAAGRLGREDEFYDQADCCVPQMVAYSVHGSRDEFAYLAGNLWGRQPDGRVRVPARLASCVLHDCPSAQQSPEQRQQQHWRRQVAAYLRLVRARVAQLDTHNWMLPSPLLSPPAASGGAWQREVEGRP